MSGSTKIVRLSFKGRTGHPILYAQELLQEIMKMPATATAKVLMSKYVNETEFVEIDSDAILYDADTPEDFEAIKKLVHPSGA